MIILKRLLLAIALLLALLAAVLVVRTALFASRQIAPPAVALPLVDAQAGAARLSRAVRIRTLSPQDPSQFPADQFLALHAYLTQAYPALHRRLKRETVNDYSLLYTWPGSDPALPALMLTAHLDVVPTALQTWSHDPFGGEIRDGYVWGRGAMDDKASVLGLMEAVELLVQQGFRPRRTVYLAFGHDEETGGRNGAARIAALLKERGVTVDTLLDEGGAVLADVIPDVGKPVAMIGIAEKGYLTLELKVRSEGGHSMRPPPQTAIGILAGAVSRLEQHRFPPRLAGATRELFAYVGPEMPWLKRLVFANLWLFEPIVRQRMAATPTTDAAIRTTIAPTIFQAGTKENVLPGEARALVNFRILPGDTVASVTHHVQAAIDDPRVALTPVGVPFEPSPVADTGSASFRTLEQTVRTVFPEAVVAPYLVPGATDARHYAGIARNAYRFLPVAIDNDELKRMHGADERLSVANYRRLVTFYAQLVKNAAQQE